MAWLLFLPLIIFADGEDKEATPVQAPSVAVLQAVKALLRFNNTEPFLNQRDDRKALQLTLEDRCYMLRLECLEYLRNKPLDALAAMPDNPQYWANFWRYLSTSPPGKEPDYGTTTWDDPRFSMGELVSRAMTKWAVYDLARHGTLDFDRTVNFAKAVRRMASESVLLGDKVMFVAGMGISLDALNLAMYEASASDNRANLDQLIAQTALFSMQERSFQKVFAGEAAFMNAMFASAPTDPQEWLALERKWRARQPQVKLPDPELMTDLEFELDQLDGRKGLLSHEALRPVVALISEMNGSEYWGNGVDVVALGLVDTLADATIDAWSSWAAYIRSYRTLDLQHQILAALGDVYAGRVQAGTPARPAPAHWAWQWRDESLCVIEVSIHSSVSLGAMRMPEMCFHYWH